MDTQQPHTSIADRVRAIWAVVQVYVEQAVGAAEVLHGPHTGPEKKAYVTGKVMILLRALEGRVDMIPGFLEGIVFMAIEKALDWMIEKAVAKLNSGGLLNNLAGAPSQDAP